MANLISFGLVAVGLLAFMISTRQWRWPFRAAIWLVGLGCLGFSAWLIARDEGHIGLVRLIVDFADKIATPGDSVLVQAILRNAGSVTHNFLPLLDLFLVFAAICGLVAALAFSRGERLEKILRPILQGGIGALVGVVVTLAVVAFGLGGAIDPHGYAGVVTKSDVLDGDTFFVGDTSLRLQGADAPERSQQCYPDVPCGEQARARVAELVSGGLVHCRAKVNAKGRPRESFGRPLVRCSVVGRHSSFDLADRLIAERYAVPYDAQEEGGEGRREARARGIEGGCTLWPQTWRRDRRARESFEGRRFSEIDADLLIGDCRALIASPPN